MSPHATAALDRRREVQRVRRLAAVVSQSIGRPIAKYSG